MGELSTCIELCGKLRSVVANASSVLPPVFWNGFLERVERLEKMCNDFQNASASIADRETTLSIEKLSRAFTSAALITLQNIDSFEYANGEGIVKHHNNTVRFMESMRLSAVISSAGELVSFRKMSQ